VQLNDNGEALGEPVALDDSGNATVEVSSLSVGTHEITATYVPTTGSPFAGSTSEPVTQVVEAVVPPTPPGVTVRVNVNAPPGTPVSVEVNVNIGPPATSPPVTPSTPSPAGGVRIGVKPGAAGAED
jgi:hypothetical protein